MTHSQWKSEAEDKDREVEKNGCIHANTEENRRI